MSSLLSRFIVPCLLLTQLIYAQPNPQENHTKFEIEGQFGVGKVYSGIGGETIIALNFPAEKKIGKIGLGAKIVRWNSEKLDISEIILFPASVFVKLDSVGVTSSGIQALFNWKHSYEGRFFGVGYSIGLGPNFFNTDTTTKKCTSNCNFLSNGTPTFDTQTHNESGMELMAALDLRLMFFPQSVIGVEFGTRHESIGSLLVFGSLLGRF